MREGLYKILLGALVVLIGVAIIRVATYKPPAVAPVESIKDVKQVERAIQVSPKEAKQIASAPRGPVIERYTAPTVREVIRYEEATRKEHRADKVLVEQPKPDAPKDVNVYRITLKKEHKIKAGLQVVDGRAYPAVAYQAGHVEGVAAFDGSHVKSATVLYTIKEW